MIQNNKESITVEDKAQIRKNRKTVIKYSLILIILFIILLGIVLECVENYNLRLSFIGGLTVVFLLAIFKTVDRFKLD